MDVTQVSRDRSNMFFFFLFDEKFLQYGMKYLKMSLICEYIFFLYNLGYLKVISLFAKTLKVVWFYEHLILLTKHLET